jgi:glucose 1-dehydrogenase
VLTVPDGSRHRPGDLVMGVVRRPDPVPCPSCARGEWDMCRNGRYTERGIKGLHGYGSERWTIEDEFAIPVDASLGLLGVLTEPTSVVAKAWEHVELIGGRSHFEPERVLVTGAGPIGLLAALLGVERGLEVHVLDRVTEGPKPRLVERLGAHYHSGNLQDVAAEADVIVEATGVSSVVLDVMAHNRPGGVVCLTGVSSAGRTVELDAGALNRSLVLENDVVFGSVNANRRHYEAAADALAKADRSWLESVITRRLPLDRFDEAIDQPADDIKTVVDFAAR